MSKGIATAQLNRDDLDVYLSFPVWQEVVVVSTMADTDDDLRARQAQVRELLARQSSGWLGDAPFVLKYPISLMAMVKRIPADKQVALFDICDALNRERPPCVVDFSDAEIWQRAIRLVRAAPSRNIDSLSRFSRSMAVAKSILQIEAAGYPVVFNAFGAFFEDAVLKSICSDLNRQIRRCGGYQSIMAIFNWYVARKRIYHGSLLFGRTVDQLGNPRDPSIPWGYLYNLAVKHLDVLPEPGVNAQDFQRALELARDMTAVFDVERYTIYEAMHGISHSGFHNAISEPIHYDELFAFQQWQPEVAPDLFRILFDQMESKGAKIPLATSAQWLAWIGRVLGMARDGELIVSHPSECLTPEVDIALSTTLFSALGIQIADLNRDFLTPLETSKRNAPLHPFYAYPTGLYFLPPRALVARGLFEAITALLRKHNKNAENWLGEILEEMTAQAIAQIGHRPEIVQQKYRVPGQRKRDASYDIDVAAESPRHFFLLECKKKALTNTARSGNTLSAALDFTRAFVQPLVQANRHEIQLLSPAGLTLLDGRNFKLGDRVIQRLAITMTDHGSMLDRPFLRGMIGALWSSTLRASIPAQQSGADEINRTMREFENNVQQLQVLTGDTTDRFLHNYIAGCWFFSVDILFFLCRGVDDLWAAISPLGAITNGTSDVMTELANHDRSGLLAGLRATIRPRIRKGR